MWVGLLRKPTSADQTSVFAFNLAPSFSPAFTAFSARCFATPPLPSSCFACFDFQCHFCCIDACSVLLVEGQRGFEQSHTADFFGDSFLWLKWPWLKWRYFGITEGPRFNLSDWTIMGVGCKWVVWAPHRGTHLSVCPWRSSFSIASVLCSEHRPQVAKTFKPAFCRDTF